jgi:hypothetical protein
VAAGSSDRGADVFCVVGLFVAALAFWWLKVVLPPERTLVAGDIYRYFYPLFHEAAAQARSGHWPLWNPYQLCGTPLLAVIQPGLFYPFNALHLVLPTAHALAAGAVLHLVLAGVFMYAWIRSLGLGWLAALIAAVVWSYALAPVNMVLQPNAFAAQVWFPVVLLAVDSVVRSASSRAAAALGGALAMPLLAGAPQFAAHAGYAVILYAPARLLEHHVRERRIGRTLRVGLLLGAGGVIALGLCAVQLLPTLELTAASTRALGGLSLEAAQFTDAPAPSSIARGLIAPLATERRYTLAYFGLTPLALAVASLFSLRHLAVRGALLALALVTFGLSSGTSGLLFQGFYHLPTGNWFRGPVRFLTLFTFLAAALAAFGTETVAARAAVATSRLGSRRSAALGALAAMLIALVAIDLYLSYGLLTAGRQIANPLRAAEEIDPLALAFASVRPRTGLDRVVVLAKGTSMLERNLIPKCGTLSHLFVVEDYEPMVPRCYAEYFSHATNGRPASAGEQWQGDFRVLPPLAHPALLSIASVRFLLTAVPLEQSIGTAAMLRLGYRSTDPPTVRPTGHFLYENVHALPRAYLASWPRYVASPTEALAHLGDERFDATREVVLEEVPPAGGDGSPRRPAEARGHVRIASYEPSRVVLDVESDNGGLVVLTDLHYPGWRAMLDGREVPILRANYLFRAVRVAPGAHRIVHRYVPGSFRAGGSISLATLGAVLWLCLRSRSRVNEILAADPGGADGRGCSGRKSHWNGI